MELSTGMRSKRFIKSGTQFCNIVMCPVMDSLVHDLIRINSPLTSALDTFQGHVLTPAAMSDAEDLTPPPFKRLLGRWGAALLRLGGNGAGGRGAEHRPILLGSR